MGQIGHYQGPALVCQVIFAQVYIYLNMHLALLGIPIAQKQSRRGGDVDERVEGYFPRPRRIIDGPIGRRKVIASAERT